MGVTRPQEQDFIQSRVQMSFCQSSPISVLPVTDRLLWLTRCDSVVSSPLLGEFPELFQAPQGVPLARAQHSPPFGPFHPQLPSQWAFAVGQAHNSIPHLGGSELLLPHPTIGEAAEMST